MLGLAGLPKTAEQLARLEPSNSRGLQSLGFGLCAIH